MTLHLSVEQARSLGILARAGLDPASRGVAKGVPGIATGPATQTPAALALAAATAPRKSAKGGRLPRVEGEPVPLVEFTVDHPPRTKQRARTQISKQAVVQAFLQARGSVGLFAKLLGAIPHRSFTPKSTEEFERAIADAASVAMAGREPVRTPVKVEVSFAFEGAADKWPTDVTDADLDNLEKAVLDGLNKVVWSDDRLVVRKEGIKECAAVPGVRVKVLLLPA